MQKMINNAVTVLLGLVIGSLFFFAVQAKAEPPNFDQTGYRDPLPRQQQRVQEKSEQGDLITQTVNIILAQGFSGAIIVVLFGFIWREGKNNRATHQENFDKYASISAECSGHMAEVSSRLEGIERELEQTKTLSMLKRS
tara:strand:+ start:201 stop:620 length:420 start_codon:yes stop_codon:yes gene_type:complete